MAFVHGKTTYVSLNAVNLSAYANSSELTVGADQHDTTTYGQTGHTFAGGLTNSTASLEGIYDSTASVGPRAAILALVGTNVTFIRRPEGTGTGKPQDSATVLVGEYTESSPVADYVKWSVKLQVSGAITSTTQ
jgi:hypothetical protein